MNTHDRHNQSGFTQVAVLGICVSVALIVGLIAYRLAGTTKPGATQQSSQEVSAKNTCNEAQDKDICKFVTTWQSTKSYHIDISNMTGGQSSKGIFEIDNDKTRLVSIASSSSYEIITTSEATYISSVSGAWWKQKIAKPEDDPAADYKYAFDLPDSKDPEKVRYESLGKEACGELQCFVYKVHYPKDMQSTEQLWFDNEDYLVRRIRQVSVDGTTSEQKFSYENISIAIPDNAKELKDNQFIVPGQSEPVTL